VRKTTPISAWAAALALFAFTAGGAPADIAIHDAWIAETPPAATVAAGYLTLENNGSETLTVTGAESPACERVEFHRMEMDGDVARMRPQETLSVEPGGTLELSSGGTHLMLIRPLQLTAGQKIPIRFTLAGGEEITFEAVVRARGHGSHEHHGH